jgi:hypothetical protein
LSDCGVEIVYFEERLNDKMKDKDGWWCGVATFQLKKL